MTRARLTLTVLAFVRPGDAVLSRRVTRETADLPRARLRYAPSDPKLVDLSFAGRLRPDDRGELAAILNWRREDGDEDYHHLLRRDEWEEALPELVFEAEAQAAMADQNGS